MRLNGVFMGTDVLRCLLIEQLPRPRSDAGVAKAVMFQGTSSSVGKTIISTALCRIDRTGLRWRPLRLRICLPIRF